MSTVFEFCLLVILMSQGTEPIRLHPDNPRWFLWRGEAVALITSAEHYDAVLKRVVRGQAAGRGESEVWRRYGAAYRSRMRS